MGNTTSSLATVQCEPGRLRVLVAKPLPAIKRRISRCKQSLSKRALDVGLERVASEQPSSIHEAVVHPERDQPPQTHPIYPQAGPQQHRFQGPSRLRWSDSDDAPSVTESKRVTRRLVAHGTTAETLQDYSPRSSLTSLSARSSLSSLSVSDNERAHTMTYISTNETAVGTLQDRSLQAPFSHETANHLLPNQTMDRSTTLAILELQLRDIQDTKAEGLAGGNMTAHVDVQMALGIQEEELQQGIGLLKDCIAYHDTARAGNEDQRMLMQVKEDMEDLLIHYNNDGTALVPTPVYHECVACSQAVVNVHAAACQEKHLYCTDCIKRVFSDTLTDDSAFPPKCCREPFLITNELRAILGNDILDRVVLKEEELATTNRTYCADIGCAEFLSPQRAHEDTIQCLSCEKSTCTLCKCLAHTGGCQDTPDDTPILDAAKEAGWQRCYQCRAVVELTTGCYHITCRCSAQFCYLCGLRWKTCRCIQCDENRLIAQARPIPRLIRREIVLHGILRAAAAPAERVQGGWGCMHDGWLARLDVMALGWCQRCNTWRPNMRDCMQCRTGWCRPCTVIPVIGLQLEEEPED